MSLTERGLSGGDLPDTLGRVASVLDAMQLGFENPPTTLELTEDQAFGLWLQLCECSNALRTEERRLLKGGAPP